MPNKIVYTPDGRKLTYATVPGTGEERWVDLENPKSYTVDGNEVFGYPYYNSNGELMPKHTQYIEPNTETYDSPQTIQDLRDMYDNYIPFTEEDVNNVIENMGYDPAIIEAKGKAAKLPQEQGLGLVFPEFDLLTLGRGKLNGAFGATKSMMENPLFNKSVYAGLGGYGTANLLGPNGVRRTARLFNEGNYDQGLWSLAGDVLDASMLYPGANFYTKSFFNTPLYKTPYNIYKNVKLANSGEPRRIINDVRDVSQNYAKNSSLYETKYDPISNWAFDRVTPEISFNPYKFVKNGSVSDLATAWGYNSGGKNIYINPLSFMLPPSEFRGLIGHEARHSYQGVLMPKLSVPGAGYYVPNPNFSITHPITKQKMNILKPFEKKRGQWQGSPDELDAEMWNWKLQNNELNTPFKDMDYNKKFYYMMNGMQRFGLSPYEVSNIMFGLSDAGYFKEGGQMNTSKKWKDLSLRDRKDIIRVGVRNGLSSLSDIRERYNEFAEGGFADDGNLNWPATSGVNYHIVSDPTFARGRSHIATFAPNQVSRLWGMPADSYEANRIMYDPVLENPYPGDNTIIYNPKYTDRDDVALDALHLMHDDPVYEDLYNDYKDASREYQDDIEESAFDEFGEEGKAILAKYYSGQELTKEEEEIINPIFDAFLRRQYAPDDKRNIPGGYAPAVPLEGDFRDKVNNIQTYMEGYPLPEVTVESNQKALGGNLYKKGGSTSRSSFMAQHGQRWYNFLVNKGLNSSDAQRLAGYFAAQDGLESAGGTSSAARQKNNFGGMQKNGKNISYPSVEAYMEDKWNMMNSRFKSALGAKTIDEYATILGNPQGNGYLYYVTDQVPYNRKSQQWQSAQTKHMHNYINGMRAWAGQGAINFNDPVVNTSNTNVAPVSTSNSAVTLPTYTADPRWEKWAEAMWPKAQAMYQELLDAGIDPVSAAGMLGNIAVESGFNPDASNNIKGGHYGYLQNMPEIRDYIVKNFGGYGHAPQTNYLIAGAKGTLPKGDMGLGKRFAAFNTAMQGITDPEMAAYLFEKHYERSNNEGIPQRMYFAKNFYDRQIAANPALKPKADNEEVAEIQPLEWTVPLVNQGVPTFNPESFQPIIDAANAYKEQLALMNQRQLEQDKRSRLGMVLGMVDAMHPDRNSIFGPLSRYLTMGNSASSIPAPPNMDNVLSLVSAYGNANNAENAEENRQLARGGKLYALGGDDDEPVSYLNNPYRTVKDENGNDKVVYVPSEDNWRYRFPEEYPENVFPHIGDNVTLSDTGTTGRMIGWHRTEGQPIIEDDKGGLHAFTPVANLPEVVVKGKQPLPTDGLDKMFVGMMAAPLALYGGAQLAGLGIGSSAAWDLPLTAQLAASKAPTTLNALANFAKGTAAFMAGDELGNMATRALTPYNSWGEGVAATTGMPRWAADFTNPFGLSAPGLFEKGAGALYKGMNRATEGAFDWFARQGNNYARARQLSNAMDDNVNNVGLIVEEPFNKRYISTNTHYGDKSYKLYNDVGALLGEGSIAPVKADGSRYGVTWIENTSGYNGLGNKAHGVSEDVYNTAINQINREGGEGLVSGETLLSPEKTERVTSRFPHTVIRPANGNKTEVRLLTGTTDKELPIEVDRQFMKKHFKHTTGQTGEVQEPTISWEDATKSKLDWSPDNWFKNISGRAAYSEEEAKELASFVPEYRQIEKRLWDEGKLIIDSDGNIRVKDSEMSPQEYIIRQSKNFQKMNKDHHFTGVNKDLVDDFENGSRDPKVRKGYEVWTDRKSPKNVEEYAYSGFGGRTIDDDIRILEKDYEGTKRYYEDEIKSLQEEREYLGSLMSDREYNRRLHEIERVRDDVLTGYEKDLKVLTEKKEIDPLNGGKVYDVTWPEETIQTPIIDAEGSHWSMIPFKNARRDAPDLVSHYSEEGPLSGEISTDALVSAARRHGYGVTNIDNVMDTKSGALLNESIIGRNTPVKSVLGSTGAFDITGPNTWKLYRSFLPWFTGIGTGAAYSMSKDPVVKAYGGNLNVKKKYH